MFPQNLCCCVTADAVQDIIRVVAVVHALHPVRDSQVYLLEHEVFHIHERLRNNTTKLLGDILLRLGAETREDMHRDLHIHSVRFVIKTLMNGVTSHPQSCRSETSRANQLSFSIIVSSKYNLLMRCALPNSSNCTASPVIVCSSCCACSGQRAASSVLNSCLKCERVKLPSFSSRWAEAISCHIINWKNGTKWFNCVNDKFHLTSLVWPVAGERDAHMMMLRHSAILEKERLQS